MLTAPQNIFWLGTTEEEKIEKKKIVSKYASQYD